MISKRPCGSVKILFLISVFFLAAKCRGKKDAITASPARPPAETAYSGHSGLSEGQSLRLLISSPPRSYGRGENIDLEVRVINEGQIPWTIFPGFTPEHHTPSGYPTSELSFMIVDQNHVAATYSGFYEELSEPASVHAFFPVPRGYFMGLKTSITKGEFCYALRGPGVYSVQARLRHMGKEWVKAQMRAKKLKPEDLVYDVETVFDGSLISNSIQVTIHD